MSLQNLVGVVTPLLVAILIWGVGLSLTWSDFLKIKNNPRIIFVSMAIQLIVFPIFAMILISIFKLSSLLSIGVMLLASTPGGTTANIFSYIAKGNVALNITLTAINTLIGIFFVPLMVYVAYYLYQDSGTVIPLQFAKLMQVLLILIIPMVLGIYTKNKFPEFARAGERFTSKFSFVALLFILVVGLTGEREIIFQNLTSVGPVVVLLNLGALFFGFLGAKYLKLSKADSSAMIMELGVHNCVLAVGIALSPQLLNSVVISIPAAVYVVVMYLTAFPLAMWFRRSS